jgi:hypothetical protein
LIEDCLNEDPNKRPNLNSIITNKIAAYEQELSKPVNLRKITIPIMMLG